MPASDLSGVRPLGGKVLRKRLSAWDETLCRAKGLPNWRLKRRKAEKCLMSFWSRGNVHMTAIVPIRSFK